MRDVIDYIKKPETLRKAIVLAFILWWFWIGINMRMINAEQRLDKIELLDLWSKLSRIETDISWIKTTLSTEKK